MPPLPILRADLAPDELIGLDALRRFGAGLYGELDPTAVLHPGEPMTVTATDAGYELSIELPFADKDELELGRRDDELLIRVRAYRRALLLPDSLRRRPVAAAALKDGRLRVTFAGEPRQGGRHHRTPRSVGAR